MMNANRVREFDVVTGAVVPTDDHIGLHDLLP